MKSKLFVFFLLYILVPVLVIPYLCLKTGNWFGLFGVVLYFSGVIIAKYKQWIFLPIPLFCCLWYWYAYGFGMMNFVSGYLFCLLAGVVFYESNRSYKRFMSKILPEQLLNIDYDLKVEELYKRLDQYRKNNPNEKMTYDTVEKIRTDVFFQ
jgi:uncharacterized membrane protein